MHAFQAGADLNLQVKQDDNTALHRAAEMGHTQVVAELVKSKKALDVQNRFGSTALHTAASNGHCQVLEILIKAGADLKIQNKGGKTAIQVAKNDEISRF